FAITAVGGFVVGGHWILGMLAGNSYFSAYPVVLTMFAGSALAMVFFWARPLLLVRGYAQTLLYVSVAAFITQLAGIYLLVPLLGAVGAGLAFTLNYVVHVGLYLHLISKTRGEIAVKMAGLV